jgi:hypothetical protein
VGAADPIRPLLAALDTATADVAFRSTPRAVLREWTTPDVFRRLRQDEPAP